MNHKGYNTNIKVTQLLHSNLQRQIQDFPKGGAWVVAGMDISYLEMLSILWDREGKMPILTKHFIFDTDGQVN